MPENIFQRCREEVSALEAARYYGYPPNRAGFIPCPFHHENTASLKLYNVQSGNGFYCFGCQKGGSVIDFVSEIFDLKPIDAVRKLNADFNLGLALGNRHTPPNWETLEAAKQRADLSETFRFFEKWRVNTIQRLNNCLFVANTAFKSLESPAYFRTLCGGEVTAIKNQAYIEYISDALETGKMPEKVEIFKQRRHIETLCCKILTSSPNTPKKFA